MNFFFFFDKLWMPFKMETNFCHLKSKARGEKKKFDSLKEKRLRKLKTNSDRKRRLKWVDKDLTRLWFPWNSVKIAIFFAWNITISDSNPFLRFIVHFWLLSLKLIKISKNISARVDRDLTRLWFLWNFLTVTSRIRKIQKWCSKRCRMKTGF